MLNEIKIIPAKEKDINEILEIERISFKSPWSYAQFLIDIKSCYSHLFVAKLNHKVIGYIDLWEEGDCIHLSNLATSPSYRGKGIGKKLMNYAFEFAKKLNFEKILLEVRESNTSAINFYKSVGFEEVTIRPRYYGDEDAIVMKKNL